MKIMTKPANRLSRIKEYYFSAKLKEIRQLQQEGRDIINLGIGSPDQMPDRAVIDRLAESALKPENHGYQPYQGLPELVESIRAFYCKCYNVNLTDSESVLPLIGSKEGITHISLAYLNSGDQVLIPSLGYPTYTSVTRMMEAVPVYYPLLEKDKWEPDWVFLEELDTSKVKLMWLNYTHMPTGVRGSIRLLERFVRFARERDILLGHDNPYSFLLNENPLSIFNIEGAIEVSIELNSLSKIYNMAGWRVGWMVGKKTLIDPALQIKSNMDSGMFKPIQEAAVQALSLDESWRVQLNEEYTKRKEIVIRILDALNCSYSKDQAGMFIWAKVSDGTGEQFSNRLLEEKQVFITPGFIFGDAGRDYIRVSLCTSQDKLEEVYNRVQ